MSKSIHTELVLALKLLRLPVIRTDYRAMADRARQAAWSYEQFLYELVSQECQEREQKRINRFLKLSRLPLEKSLKIFDRDRLPPRVNAQLSALLDGSFLDRTENILAFGNPGSGKTHLLCAIGQELTYLGRKICFRACSLLVQDLLIAKKELKLAKLLKSLAKYDALIIDDLGYVQHDREEMEVLFTLLAEMYERRSVLLTSNLPFSQWEQIFKDPMTTAAAIDRLVHHSIILELNVPSFRLEESKKKINNPSGPPESPVSNG
jgi:DNA replication protein DnaC